MRVVFMGTPVFAVVSLRRLMSSSHDIVGVVTPPDRPKGRGRQMSETPVKLQAKEFELPIHQPDCLTDPTFLEWLDECRADCFVVVGFRILPPVVYERPQKGSINLHASLLPKYRGAAPIQWALIRGETETGVSTFYIQRKVDTGDLILQRGLEILPEDTAGDLHDKLADIGAELLEETVNLIADGKAVGRIQTGEPTTAPKILPHHCVIDWHKPAVEIVNLIRGLSPVPCAHTTWNGKRLKIYRATAISESGEKRFSPGYIVNCDPKGIIVQTGQDCIQISDLQMEGKRRMTAREFACGSQALAETQFS